jgi:hypothetical protein
VQYHPAGSECFIVFASKGEKELELLFDAYTLSCKKCIKFLHRLFIP